MYIFLSGRSLCRCQAASYSVFHSPLPSRCAMCCSRLAGRSEFAHSPALLESMPSSISPSLSWYQSFNCITEHKMCPCTPYHTLSRAHGQWRLYLWHLAGHTWLGRLCNWASAVETIAKSYIDPAVIFLPTCSTAWKDSLKALLRPFVPVCRQTETHGRLPFAAERWSGLMTSVPVNNYFLLYGTHYSISDR